MNPSANYWKYLVETGNVWNHIFVGVCHWFTDHGFGKRVAQVRKHLAKKANTTYHEYGGNCGGYEGWYTVGPKLVIGFKPIGDAPQFEW